MSKITHDQTRTKSIASAYEKLSDDDMIQVDKAVNKILAYYARRNADRKNFAHFSFSRANALELIASIGIKLSGKVWPEPEE